MVLAIIQAIGVSVGLFRQALISTDFFSVAVIVLGAYSRYDVPYVVR